MADLDLKDFKKFTKEFTQEVIVNLRERAKEAGVSWEQYNALSMEVAAQYAAISVAMVISEKEGDGVSKEAETVVPQVYDLVLNLLRDQLMEHGAFVIRVDHPEEPEGEGGT